MNKENEEKMNKYKKVLVFSLFLMILTVLPVRAQIYPLRGKLNVWTDKSISRVGFEDDKQELNQFVKIKTGKNDGFDRVVFEFKKNLPGYHLEYQNPPFELEDGKTLKVSGKAFVSIQFSLVPYSETDDFKVESLEVLKPTINLPVIREIRNSEFFEGYLSFVIGLKDRKLFRVQQLSNPARLVIDFKN